MEKIELLYYFPWQQAITGRFPQKLGKAFLALALKLFEVQD
jgi:hypothetical protein